MTVTQGEVYEAFRAINVPEQEAVKAAAALSWRHDDVVSPQGELLVITWMMDFVLGFQVLIFGKLFMH